MKIGVWGDSITYGEGDSDALGWVGRFRKSFPVKEYVTVYNRGVCGNTSSDLLKRFPVEVASINPEKIVFAIGTNDAKYPVDVLSNKVSYEDFGANMRMLVEQAQSYTQDVCIIGLMQVDESVKRFTGVRYINSDLQRYSDFLQELAHEKGCTFINVFDALNLRADLFDGLHPNADGYEKLFHLISSHIMSTQ